MGLDLIRTSVCDADIIVKLARAGELAELGRIQDEVLIPERVRLEALRKIGTRCKGLGVADCINQGWLRVLDINISRSFQPEERALIGTYLEMYRDILHPGELEAVALAYVKRIPALLSDERTVQEEVEKGGEITVLRLHEVLAVGEVRGVYSREQAVALFDKINVLQDYPTSRPAAELLAEGVKRLKRLTADRPQRHARKPNTGDKP